MMKLTFLSVLFFCGFAGLTATPWQGFTALALSPDGHHFATGGREGQILLWEVATGELLAQWNTLRPYPVVGLNFNRDGTQLGIALLDGTLWSATPGDAPLALNAPGSEWSDLAGAKNHWLSAGPLASGLRVASGSLWANGTPDGQITVGNQGGHTLASWPVSHAAVTGLALADDGSFLLSCSYDGNLSLWNPQTGQNRGTLQSAQ